MAMTVYGMAVSSKEYKDFCDKLDNADSIGDYVECYLGSINECIVHTGCISNDLRTKAKNNLVDKADSLTGVAGGLVGRLVGGSIGSIAGKAIAKQFSETQEFTCDEDDIVAIVDASVLKNCAEGLVFTNNGVFFSQLAGVSIYIEYDDILATEDSSGAFGEKLVIERFSNPDFTWDETRIPKDRLSGLLDSIISYKESEEYEDEDEED